MDIWVNFNLRLLWISVYDHFYTTHFYQRQMRAFYNDKIHQEDKQAPKYMKQKLTELKGETDNSAIIVWNVDTPLSIMDRTTRASRYL